MPGISPIKLLSPVNKGSSQSWQSYWMQQKIAIILNRSNPIGQWDAKDLTTITKDGSNIVSEWRDKLGSGKKFNIGSCTWDAVKGMTFNGTTERLKFLLDGVAPLYVFISVTQKTFVNSAYIFKASGINIQQTAAGYIYFFASQYLYSNSCIADEKDIIRAFVDGSDSKLAVKSDVGPIGTLTNLAFSNICLGSDENGTDFSNIEVTDLIIVQSLTTADEIQIYNYLKWKNHTNGNIFDMSAQQAHHTSLGFGTLCSSNIFPFGASVWDSVVNYLPPNTFNPTDVDMQGFVDECLDTYQAAGMNYVVIYAKAEAGFCMWPTLTHVDGYEPYSIAQSDYYKNNGHPDYVKMMVDGCRSRGLEPHLYTSVFDAVWERRTGKTEADAAEEYLQFNLDQITELLSNYGDIKVFWIDDWGWHIPETEVGGFPFWRIQDHIKRIQPNCLLINNDHHFPADRSEIAVYEYLYDSIPAVGNVRPSEQFKGNRIDGNNVYFTGQSQTPSDFMNASDIIDLLVTVNARTCTLLLNSTPDNTGHLCVAQKNYLQLIGANPSVLSASVENADPTKVILTMTKKVDDTSIPTTTDFALTGKTISNVSISGATITITVSLAYAYGDNILLNYTKGANKIKDLLRHETASFSNQAVVNNVQSAFLSLMADGNTKGWFDFTDESKITKDGSARVSQVAVLGGANNPLLQAGADNIKPTWDANGLNFDGVRQFIKAAGFTFNQPESIYLVIKFVSAVTSSTCIDGDTPISGAIIAFSPDYYQYAGAYGAIIHPGTTNYNIIRLVNNGASSYIRLNNEAKQNGDAGASNMSGLTLGACGNGLDRWAHCIVKGCIARAVSETDGNSDVIYNALKTLYGL